MERKLAVSMFGQKRLSREGGIEIVAKELCTRMVQIVFLCAWEKLKVSAKYSCGFSDLLDSSIIVDERYLDYFTTIMEDRLWQLLAKPLFQWLNRSGLSMNVAKAA